MPERSAGLLEELQRRHEIMRRECRVWGLRAADFSSFSASFLVSPYVSWAITSTFDRYLR